MHERKFTVRTANEANYSDLRNGPVVLVGILSNPWALRLLSTLRFRPKLDSAAKLIWIEDEQHPERRDWNVPWGQSYSEYAYDYALITRVQDPLTGNVTINIGGIGLHGTQAAGDFVTSAVYFSSLPRGFQSGKNVQIVLRVPVVRGQNGPPQLVAFNTW